jgi:hypothetical protein
MNFINNFSRLSNDIKLYLDNLNCQLGFKKRKTSLIDGILFKILYTMKNSTHENITTKLNLYNNKDVSRVAYTKKINNINLHVFENLYNYLNNRINHYFYNIKNNDYIIYAVDGSYIQLKEKLHTECKRKKNNTSVTALLTGIYNVTYDNSVLLKFENNETSERHSFLNIFNEIKNTYEKQIYVFDRGYLDYSLLDIINKNNEYFICRIRKNTIYIDDSKDDYIITTSKCNKLRIIKYTVNSSIFYLCTNLFNGFDIDSLKNIYNKRWSIEEYFKLIKNTTNINNINEESIINIKKSFICYNIVSKLLYLIKNNYHIQISDTNKKINLTHLTTSLYSSDFYIKFITGTFDINTLTKFFKVTIIFIYSKKHRSFDRKCKRSNSISYFKTYANNNKSTCK